MAKQIWKPGNMLYPLPAVMVSTADRSGKSNIITVAWTGTVCTNPAMLYISVRPERYSYVDVRDIKILEPDNSVCHELMMIKVAAKPEQRQGLISIADVFHAKVADVSVDSMILEMTGNHNKLEAFLELMGDYEILELARTGMTGLSRGSQDVTYF